VYVLYSTITTAPSNASNPELTTNRPAPFLFVASLPAAVPVVEGPLVVVAPLVAPVADACDGDRDVVEATERYNKRATYGGGPGAEELL
jgi:hypothetical protein